MADEHQRYERLAVGHVVGGLDEVDAARFRSHLVSCRDCRTRVAELRGIASDLLATEREERAARAGSGRTELAERLEEEEAAAPPRQRDVAPARSWPWRVVAIGLLPLVVLGALAWGVWMRAELQLTGAALGTANDALQVVAVGEQLPLDVDVAGLSGLVAATDAQVVVNLSALPQLGPNEVVRAVLLDDDGEPVVTGRRYTENELDGAWMFDVLSRDRGASTLAIQLVRQGATPGDVTVEELATATLPPVGG